MTVLSGAAAARTDGPSIDGVSRRAWAWGAGLLVLGLIVLAADVHSIITFHPAAGSDQTATLGQVIGLLFCGLVLLAAALVLGTGVRRRLEIRRRRRLRDRLAARNQLPD